MSTVPIQQEDETAILENHPEKTKNIVTAVMQEREGQWEIAAIHDAPVRKREGSGSRFRPRV